VSLFVGGGQGEVLLDQAGCKVWWQPSWLTGPEAHRVWDRLRAEVVCEPGTIRLFGREVPIPRLQAWHGDPEAAYRYSGIDLVPKPWTPTLRALVERLVAQRPGLAFNSVLVNLYRDGHDSVGWHADDEPELGAEPIIASLSLGATRRFRWKSKEPAPAGAQSSGVDLAHGDLLWMEGATQSRFLHCAPRTARAVGPRWNLTFRRVVG